MEYIFVMAGESQSWASFSSDLEPEQPLPPEMVVSRRNGREAHTHTHHYLLHPWRALIGCRKCSGNHMHTTLERLFD